VSRLADIATPLRGANGGGEVVGTVDLTMLAGATLTMYHEVAHAARAEGECRRSGDSTNDTAPTFDDRARSS
jgi:hypothetical protein